MTTRTPNHPKPKIQSVKTTHPRSSALNLINEALSRARMRSPQNASEARRPARRIAIQARRQQAREIGNLSQYGIR
jgi:hypothetical protein